MGGGWPERACCRSGIIIIGARVWLAQECGGRSQVRGKVAFCERGLRNLVHVDSADVYFDENTGAWHELFRKNR